MKIKDLSSGLKQNFALDFISTSTFKADGKTSVYFYNRYYYLKVYRSFSAHLKLTFAESDRSTKSIKGAETNLYTFKYLLFSESIQICFRTL